MKKYLSAYLLTILLVIGVSVDSWSQKKVTLTIGATPVPHTEILEKAKPILAKKGINLEIKVFTDYVIPNIALSDKSLDANYFQHAPYLESFSKEKKLSLSSVAAVHFEPLGLYSKKIKSLKELKDSDKIAVPNDLTNEARSLILLQDNGILTLKDSKNLKSTKADIKSFKVKIEIIELEAAQITRSLSSVTAAVINGNYAIDAKLNPAKDAIISEKATSVSAKTYENIVVVRKGDENRPEIKELVAVLKSAEIKKFIAEKYKGAVVAAD
jgi:D-methionine transport system substrate-binding protein